VEPLLAKLAEQGIVAIVLAISLFANYLLYKEIKTINEKRLNEAIETRNGVFEPLKAIQATVEIILKNIKIQ